MRDKATRLSSVDEKKKSTLKKYKEITGNGNLVDTFLSPHYSKAQKVINQKSDSMKR